jgi:hypothetical protein
MAIQLSSNAMTTVETVETILNLPPGSEGAQRDRLTLLINAASAWVERITGRKFGKATYTQQCNATGQQELFLREWPILRVSYVKDNTSGGRVISENEYDFSSMGNMGILYKDTGWPYRTYVGGLAYDPVGFKRCLEVKYTAGYRMVRVYDRRAMDAIQHQEA